MPGAGKMALGMVMNQQTEPWAGWHVPVFLPITVAPKWHAEMAQNIGSKMGEPGMPGLAETCLQYMLKVKGSYNGTRNGGEGMVAWQAVRFVGAGSIGRWQVVVAPFPGRHGGRQV